jgi:hypothetical protein
VLKPKNGGNSAVSKRVPVRVDDRLVGIIRLCANNNGRFHYSCEFEGIPDTYICVDNMPELVRCFVTLEPYERVGVPPHDLKSRSEYPPVKRTSFRKIWVKTEPQIDRLNWNTCTSQVAKYGEKTKAVNDSATNGRVDIYYQS